jgi:two-component system, LytTR family, sensor kinase
MSKKFKIVLYHIIAWIVFIGYPFIFFTETFPSPHIYEYLLHSFILVFVFYLNSLVLIPAFLTPRKMLLYSLSLLGVVLLATILDFWSDVLVARFISHDPNIWQHALHKPHRAVFWNMFILAVSTSYKVIVEWFSADRQKKEMQKEKLDSELAFLRSQVSPHFLFNTLNNIYSLAYKKSDKAPEAIVKLSQLMRYMLYDSVEEKVSLTNEIEYLQNYIDLQKMRLADEVEVFFTCEGDTDGILIEPMLLIPFVENAFKHGVSYTENTSITIELKLTEYNLFFKVVNPARHNEQIVDRSSGIGLHNILRRLELLYPERHQLYIQNNAGSYKVELTINLT